MYFSPLSIVLAVVMVIAAVAFPPVARNYTLTVLWGWFTYQVSLKRDREDCRVSLAYLLTSLVAGLVFGVIAAHRGVRLDYAVAFANLVGLIMLIALAARFGKTPQHTLAVLSCLFLLMVGMRSNYGILYNRPVIDSLSVVLIETAFAVLIRIIALPEEKHPPGGKRRRIRRKKRKFRWGELPA